MSNDPQSPPPLRLKPRLSAEPVTNTTTTPQDLPSDPSASSTAKAAPLPLLPVLPQVAPAPLPTITPTPLPPERVPAPLPSTPAPAPTAEDPGKFKLKPRTTAAPAGGAVSAPAVTAVPALTTPSAPVLAPKPVEPAPAPTPGSVLVAKPSLPTAALASPAFSKPATLSGRPNMPIAPLPASPPALPPVSPRPPTSKSTKSTDDSRAGQNGLKLMLALLFVALGVFGVLAYNQWFADDSAPEPVVAKPSTPASEPTTAPVAGTDTVPAAEPATPASNPDTARPVAPSLVVDNPQSLPGQLVAKAQQAVAAHDAALGNPINDLLNSTTTSVTAEKPTVQPVAEAKPTPPPEPVVAPRPEPSANFRSYVVNLKVNGVFQGENARAMLNGKMYRLGEIVEPSLGIVFLRVEPEDKRLVFEDGKGAIMSRRY